ncbi:hypothetical protein FRC09_014939 [Ceratobasidium sp. 395]|nr:hypothetical protein FRC09_014939 [Ceratobasidium sp. 395]
MDERTKEQAYIAWMGYYKTSLRDLGWTDVELVQRANDLVRYTYRYRGYNNDQPDDNSTQWIPPPIFAKTIGMMGLRDVRKHNLFNVVAPEGTRNQGQRAQRGGSSAEARPLREGGAQSSEGRSSSGRGSWRSGRGRGRGRGA